MVKFTVNFPVLGNIAVAGSETQGKVNDKLELMDFIFLLQSRSKIII